MLNLAPSLQYTAIAALSPNVAIPRVASSSSPGCQAAYSPYTHPPCPQGPAPTHSPSTTSAP
eukprot:6618669-Prymnesium_polylepis.1